jgi:signal transduction histidine kinase
LYKIAQEAETNSIRHGKPQKIGIVLSRNLDEIYLTVTDDGSGLGEEPRMQKGMGMRIMNYRASKIGGSLVFMPGDRGGTCVVCTVPANGRPESSEA